MPTISVYIPPAAFTAGNVFEDAPPNKTSVWIQLKEAGAIKITKAPVVFEDWQFHPQNARVYGNILSLVNRGMIEVLHSGSGVMTSTDLIDLFKTYFQEL